MSTRHFVQICFQLWPSRQSGLRAGHGRCQLERKGFWQLACVDTTGICSERSAFDEVSIPEQKTLKRARKAKREGEVFTSDDPRRIARSLKRSAERSTRRKAKPFQSAMSMLNLYINRAGRKLPASRRRVLARAKKELRIAFDRAER